MKHSELKEMIRRVVRENNKDKAKRAFEKDLQTDPDYKKFVQSVVDKKLDMMKKGYGMDDDTGQVPNAVKRDYYLDNFKDPEQFPDEDDDDDLLEKKLTAAEQKKKEEIVKGMKKSFKGDKSDMYRIATYQAKKLKEGEDHEVSMAISSLEAIAESIIELRQKLGNQERNIPGWIQDHIAKAENYIEQAAQGFHELNEEKDPLDVVVSEKKGKDLTGPKGKPEDRKSVV
jgi:hypothetical protein